MDQLGARAARPLRIGAGQRLALPTVPSVIVLVCLALAGCASSPVGSPSSGPSTGQLLMMGATTAGGAALGNHFNEHYGAPVGAAAGLGLGLLANQYFSDKEKRAYEEGYEQGRRDARVEVMKQYWYEKTTSLQAGSASGSAGARPIGAELVETSYNGGIVEGVRYTPRNSTQPTLTEPIRP